MTRIAPIIAGVCYLAGCGVDDSTTAKESASDADAVITPDAGGCVNKSQGGWTIRLCASKSFTDVNGSAEVLTKGSIPSHGCSITGTFTLQGSIDPPLFNSLGSCGAVSPGISQTIGDFFVIGTPPTVTPCVKIANSLTGATIFNQCATFTSV